MSYFHRVILALLLTETTSGKLIDIHASDKCGQYLGFSQDSEYIVKWNNDKAICEVKFENSHKDNIICTTAYTFSVDCDFELRLTEGLGIFPVRTFTCLHNISSVQYCSKKGMNINIEFYTSTASSSEVASFPSFSEVALFVNQTTPVARPNPFLVPVVGKVVVSFSILMILCVSSVLVWRKRRKAIISRTGGYQGCTSPDSKECKPQNVKTSTISVDMTSETSKMISSA